MIILLILWRPFAFFVLKESFQNGSSTSAHILLWGNIHAQSKEKQTFVSLDKVNPMFAGPH